MTDADIDVISRPLLDWIIVHDESWNEDCASRGERGE